MIADIFTLSFHSFSIWNSYYDNKISKKEELINNENGKFIG